MFADVDTICEAANVSVSEEEVYTCIYLAHYISVQSIIMPPTHTADVLVGALCGSKSKHCAGNDEWAPLTPLQQPDTIKILLDEAGNL